MIDPKEFRIGNILKSSDSSKLINVFHIDKDDDRGRINYIWVNNYQPIELTPEILEAAGFKYNEFTENYEIFYDAVGMVGINKYDGSFIIGNDNEDMGFTGDIKSACKYLHQLQNLIHSLTGQELQIDLQKLNKQP